MGHGHVTPNSDGSKARCGGPALCRECALEAGQLVGTEENRRRARRALTYVLDTLDYIQLCEAAAQQWIDHDGFASLAIHLSALRDDTAILKDPTRGIGDKYNASRRLEKTLAALTHTAPQERGAAE